MGLRLKNGLAVTAVFLAIITATYLLYTHILLRDFDRIERERANLNVQRVFQSIEAVTDELRGRTLDWSRWDETYAFMRGDNKGYLSTNVNYEAVAPFELVHIIFIDNNLSLRSGMEVHQSDATLRPIVPLTLSSILSNLAVNSFLKAPSEAPLSGLIRVGGAPIFISISPITNNEGTATPNGFLIFTRAFSEQLRDQIEKRIQLRLSFSEIALNEPQGGLSAISSVTTSDDEVTGTGTVRDITDSPILSFSHRAPRTIYQQGRSSRNYVVSLMSICLILANVVLIAFLNRAVIGRLERFASRIKTISSTTDFSLRVVPDGNDEIGSLVRTFNSLLQTTEETTSQLAQARDAAVQATQAKSNFVAHVSHELRSPIHGLTGLLRILFKGESSPTKRAYIQMAQDSATTLLSTINNILDLSKIESGSVDLQHIPFSLRQILRTATRTISPRVDEKTALHLLVDIAPGVPDGVIGDPLRLQQLLVNLLSNATKFTNEGSISLRVSPLSSTTDSATLIFEVADTGIGMNQEQLEKVFKPYIQADESIQVTYEGTGLGLSIVTSLMRELRGELSVTSEPQRGTTFTLSIPFEVRDHETSQTTEIARRCVVIDEESPFSSWISTGLNRYNCSAERVSPSDEAALRRVTRYYPEPDIVLLSPRALETAVTIENLRFLRASLTCPIIAALKTSDMATHEQMQMFGDITVIDAPIAAEEVIEVAQSAPVRSLPSSRQDSLIQPLNVRNCRVLVADDAPTSRLIIREMLEEAGYQVETVENGERMVRRVQFDIDNASDAPISLVLTDIEMPIMGGVEASRRIRELEATHVGRARLPIIAITAHALAEEQRRFLDSGIDYVVTKPLKSADLSQALLRITSNTQSTTPQGPSAIEPHALCAALRDLTSRLWNEVSHKDESLSEPLPQIGINIADVFERSGESPRRTKLILSAFLDSYREPLHRLTRVGDLSRVKEVTVAAHSLKGLLLDVGATHTAERAARLESFLRVGDYESAARSCGALTEETSHIATLVERVVRHFPSLQS